MSKASSEGSTSTGVEITLGRMAATASVLIDGKDVSNCVTAIEVKAKVGDLTRVELSLLPESVRIATGRETVLFKETVPKVVDDPEPKPTDPRVVAARWVHPTDHNIEKLILSENPPGKGDVVVVDGERHRVIQAFIEWDHDPSLDHPSWSIVRPGLLVESI